MLSLAEVQSQSNSVAEVVTAYRQSGLRFVVIHQNDQGKVILHRNQRGSLTLQHMPSRMPSPVVLPLVLETQNGAQADTTAIIAWLTEVAEVMGVAQAIPDPVDMAAAELIAEYGHDFEGRLERAVELVKAGKTEFPHYETSYDLSGFYGLRSCQCPDAEHRNPRAKFGAACKHALAQEIALRLAQDSERVAQAEWTEETQRKRDDGRTTADRQARWEAGHPVDDYGVREQALPSYVDRTGRLEDWLGYDEEIPF